MTEFIAPTLTVYPYDTDLIQLAAQAIIENNRHRLPDLSHCIVLLPNYQVASMMRKAILQTANAAGYSTVLGAKIFLLKDYVLKNTLVDHSQLSPIASELLIINSLNDNKNLFGASNTLTSSYALLDLINLLTSHQVILPENIQAFKQQLINAYKTQTKEFAGLSQEAQLIFSIWQAWHTQLAGLQLVDQETLYQLKLGENPQQSAKFVFYLVGNQKFLPSEIKWLKQKLTAEQLTIFLQGEAQKNQTDSLPFSQQITSRLDCETTYQAASTERSRYYSLAFDSSKGILQNRTQEAKNAFPLSPIKNQLNIFQGYSFEEEALAIQLQVRRWLSEGKKDISLVLEDRKLARRVRALLERHGIGIYDSEGWALSTSAAASIVESLLEAIEENFNHVVLLNLMKSSFIFTQDETHIQATARLEMEIIQREKIYNNLDRYKNAIKSRQKRLNIPVDEISSALIEALDKLHQASNTLQALVSQDVSNVSTFNTAIIEILKQLGIYRQFEQDVAGQAIIQLLDTINSATEKCDSTLSWVELRQWFAKKLEENTFTVTNPYATQIKLLHLRQTNLTQHEAIIIGNFVRGSFPGATASTPFFNQRVYHELGLPNVYQEHAENFFYFRRLLDSANNILLSYHHGEQEAQASPWLELLRNFHLLTYNQDLIDPLLNKMLQANLNLSSHTASTETRETATINNIKLPEKISASAHQTLINCPYAYHLSEVLSLRAPEEIRQTLAKSDYGERVHFILFLFHQGKDDSFPAPFKENISAHNKMQAIQRLIEISRIIFHRDLEDNFQHRGWYKRWLNVIPLYIDWLEQDQIEWAFDSGEISATHKLSDDLIAYGRIDRVDSSNKSDKKRRIIDYKTGAFAKQQAVESGEAVQLTHYALASNNSIAELGYLALESKGKALKAEIILQADNLSSTQQAAEKRLIDIKQQMQSGTALTAWGDEQTCSYCQFDGICRTRLD